MSFFAAYGIFNMQRGRSRVCVYHLSPGEWYAQICYSGPGRIGGEYWGRKTRIPAKLGLKLVLGSKCH